MPRDRREVKVTCITKDFPEIDKLEVWYQHLISVNRPCAIIRKDARRIYRGKRVESLEYTVWRTVDESEQEAFVDICCDNELPEEYAIIREFGGFSEIVKGVV